MESYLINVTSQQSHWTLGAVYQTNFGGCQPMRAKVLISTNLHLSNRLQVNRTLFECHKIQLQESKTVYSIGQQEFSSTITTLPIDRELCAILVKTRKDLDGLPLLPINSTTVGTNRRPTTYSSWTGTVSDTITNYYILTHNVTLNFQGFLSATTLTSLAPCTWMETFCELPSSMLVWGPAYRWFYPDQPCYKTDHLDQTCVFYNYEFHCPELGIRVLPINAARTCGIPVGYSRMVVTESLQSRLAGSR
jgi:hypothetical protein